MNNYNEKAEQNLLEIKKQKEESDKIISELENGEIDLEDSIEKYTKAMNLVKECDGELKNIEEKVNKILNENGQIQDFNVEE